MFLKILKQNIYQQLSLNNVNGLINITNSRIFLSKFDDKDISVIESILSNTFGVDSFSFAFIIPTVDQNEIFDFVKQNYSKYILPTDTFKIKAKCINVPYHSKDLEIQLAELFPNKVDLTHPSKTIYIEAREKTTCIFTEKQLGLSGLPVGASGRNLVLISGGIDSPVASFLTLKRGCHNTYLHFHSFPYVSKASIEKVKEILLKFKKYQNEIKLILFPFAEIQNYIKVSSDPSLRIILYRRSMMRLASKIARDLKCKAITTGESLSQVSSQTLDNLAVINEALKIFSIRPLIAYNKDEIIKIAEKIGTIDISNEPQEDTCTLFTPKHPNAQTALWKIQKVEQEINIEEFESKLLEKIETIIL
jgi:thiamine biosynthesis protein ThiI